MVRGTQGSRALALISARRPARPVAASGSWGVSGSATGASRPCARSRICARTADMPPPVLAGLLWPPAAAALPVAPAAAALPVARAAAPARISSSNAAWPPGAGSGPAPALGRAGSCVMITGLVLTWITLSRSVFISAKRAASDLSSSWGRAVVVLAMDSSSSSLACKGLLPEKELRGTAPQVGPTPW